MKKFKTRTGITSGKKERSWTASERKRDEEKKDQPKWQGEIRHRQDTQAMTGRIQDLLATEARHRLSGTHTPDTRPMREWIEAPHLGKPKTVENDIISIDTRSTFVLPFPFFLLICRSHINTSPQHDDFSTSLPHPLLPKQ